MRRQYALAAILGGLLWIALHVALTGAWERGDAFPTYEHLNALRPLPLAFFTFALYGLHRAVNTGRNGLILSLAGFALLAAGAALEFWVGGGVRDGDVDTLSLVGWMTYLLGFLVLSVGLVAFGVAVYRTQSAGAARVIPLLMGIVWASWFPLIIMGNIVRTDYSDVAQYLFALLWIAMGALMWKDDATRPMVSKT